MNQQLTPFPPLAHGLTVEDLEFARIYHTASPELQTILKHLATARVLTQPQIDLLTRYDALSPARQALVDELIRELGQLPPNATADH